MARFSSRPWFEKIEQQQGGKRDDAGREDHCSGLRSQRMREGIFEDINSASKKQCGLKKDEAPESVPEAGANDQRFGTTHGRFVMHKPTVHGLFFHRIAESELGLRKSKKIQVLKNGWSIFLLHQAAASAARILSLNFAANFQRSPDFIFTAIYLTSPGPSGWDVRKAISGWSLYVGRSTVCRSKRKSKRNLTPN